MSHDVFISYSSIDKKIADAIKHGLHAAGIRCWMAPDDVAPGADWATEITYAIEASKVMVLVWTSASMASFEVPKELGLAMSSKVVVIPVRLEDIQPKGSFKYHLSARHWLDGCSKDLDVAIVQLKNLVALQLRSGQKTLLQQKVLKDGQPGKSCVSFEGLDDHDLPITGSTQAKISSTSEKNQGSSLGDGIEMNLPASFACGQRNTIDPRSEMLAINTGHAPNGVVQVSCENPQGNTKNEPKVLIQQTANTPVSTPDLSAKRPSATTADEPIILEEKSTASKRLSAFVSELSTSIENLEIKPFVSYNGWGTKMDYILGAKNIEAKLREHCLPFLFHETSKIPDTLLIRIDQNTWGPTHGFAVTTKGIHVTSGEFGAGCLVDTWNNIKGWKNELRGSPMLIEWGQIHSAVLDNNIMLLNGQIPVFSFFSVDSLCPTLLSSLNTSESLQSIRKIENIEEFETEEPDGFRGFRDEESLYLLIVECILRCTSINTVQR